MIVASSALSMASAVSRPFWSRRWIAPAVLRPLWVKFEGHQRKSRTRFGATNEYSIYRAQCHVHVFGTISCKELYLLRLVFINQPYHINLITGKDHFKSCLGCSMASLVHRKLPSNFKQSQLQTQKVTYGNIFLKKNQYTSWMTAQWLIVCHKLLFIFCTIPLTTCSLLNFLLEYRFFHTFPSKTWKSTVYDSKIFHELRN